MFTNKRNLLIQPSEIPLKIKSISRPPWRFGHYLCFYTLSLTNMRPKSFGFFFNLLLLYFSSLTLVDTQVLVIFTFTQMVVCVCVCVYFFPGKRGRRIKMHKCWIIVTISCPLVVIWMLSNFQAKQTLTKVFETGTEWTLLQVSIYSSPSLKMVLYLIHRWYTNSPSVRGYFMKTEERS